MKKDTAHNELEVRILIEEAFSTGTEEKYHKTRWYKHDSEELLCVSRIDLVGYYLDLENHSIYKEL